jgi:ketosteroid isomerase-like protein
VPSNAVPLRPTTAEIEALRDSYTKAYNKGNAHAVAMMFTPDALMINSGGEQFQGRDSIEAALKAELANAPHLTSKGGFTKKLGDWGWQVGTSEFSATMNGKPLNQRGRYLAILGHEGTTLKIRALISVVDTSGTRQMQAQGPGGSN